MIGNDIVDLADAGTPSPRFLARVLAPEERRHEAQIWRLWAAKEAAYKLLVRDDASLPFAHRLFVVDLEARLVRHPSATVHVRWNGDERHVGCVAWRDADTDVFAASEPRGDLDEPSASVRSLARRLLQVVLGRDDETIEILRSASGPPEVWRGGRRDDGLSVSLSHDGRYVAAAIGRRRTAHAVP